MAVIADISQLQAKATRLVEDTIPEADPEVKRIVIDKVVRAFNFLIDPRSPNPVVIPPKG